MDRFSRQQHGPINIVDRRRERSSSAVVLPHSAPAVRRNTASTAGHRIAAAVTTGNGPLCHAG